MRRGAHGRACPRLFTEMIPLVLQTAMRGMTGSGDGVHVMTGPIYVKEAEPGDVLKVEILKLYPRVNPKGESYGVNVSIGVDLQ